MSEKLLVLCMLVAAATSYDMGCQYQLNQCYGRMQNMEQKVNQVDARLNIMQGRQSAVTQALSQEVGVLDQDTKTVKSVVNTLVEDNVKMHGDIRLLKGHGDAIVGLRRQVDNVKRDTEWQVNGVNRKVDQVTQSLHSESEAVNKITVLMSQQMGKNGDSLKDLKTKLEQIESKMNEMESIKGMVDEITGRLDGIQEQIEGVRAE